MEIGSAGPRGHLGCLLHAPEGGTWLRACQLSVSSPVSGDNSLPLETCRAHHLYGLSLAQGTFHSFPAQGPEQPPSSSLSRVLVSVCVHTGLPGFRKGRGTGGRETG